MWILIFQRVSLDFFLHLLYFPLWWYTGGVKRVGVVCLHLIQDTNTQLAPGLWLKNIFVPMFGQRDWQGRITSVFVRFFNVIFRAIGLFIWIWFVGALFLLWLVFPVFVIFMLGRSIIA